jgi:predicted nuclease with TOPRIM domain
MSKHREELFKMGRTDLVNRIKKLELDKTSLKEKLSLYLGGWPSLEQRIEELEAEIRLLQAKLDAVRQLPREWRRMEQDGWGVDGNTCTDELEAALQKEKSDE